MDTKMELSDTLCESLRWGRGGHVGPASGSPGGDESKEAEAERFGESLYRIRTAVNHAIAAHYQAMAGEVNAEKLRMLVEQVDANTVRVGNYLITRIAPHVTSK